MLGLFIFVRHLRRHQLRAFVPEGVVTRKQAHFFKINIDDVRTNHVQKVTVVRDDDNRIFVIRQKVREPGYRFRIEVVGRLIEHQQVGRAEKCLRQQYLYALGTAKVFHQFVVQIFANTEVTEQFRRVAFRRPAAHFAVLIFKFGGAQTLGFGRLGVHINGVFFLRNSVQFFVAHHHGIQHVVLFKLEVILLQHRHTIARFEADAAAIGVEFTRQYFHKGGLARTVGTDDAVAVAARKFNIDLIKEDTLAELKTEFRYC